MILTCGEALMDVFVAAGNGLRHPAIFAMGGSPFNVAVALARQGVPAGFFGGLSQDAFGTMLRSILAAEGVDDRLAPTLSCKTTLSIVSCDQNGQPHYDFRGSEGADIMVDLAHVPVTLPETCQALALSSYPLVVDPVRHAMAAMVERAGSRVVSIDVNYRAALVGNAALWAERFALYEPMTTIMKASEDDLAHAYGGARHPDDAAAHWLKRGAALVLITRGEKGATAYRADGRIDVAAPRVTAIDTVGAGDCFHAGFLAALATRHALTRTAIQSLSADALRDCLIWAVTAASLSVTRQGADPPHAAAIEAALNQPSSRFSR